MDTTNINREIRDQRHLSALCERPLAVTTPAIKRSRRGRHTAGGPERRRAGRRGGTRDNRRGRGRGTAPPSWRGGYGAHSLRGTALSWTAG